MHIVVRIAVLSGLGYTFRIMELGRCVIAEIIAGVVSIRIWADPVDLILGAGFCSVLEGCSFLAS